MKTALLLVNMGGPSSLDEIEPYMRAIFNDPAILSMPWFIRKPLASYIVSKRKAKVAERYNLIGGASPLPKWTEKLKQSVQSILNDSDERITAVHAFRYTSPTIEETLTRLAKDTFENIILLPLFPHFTKAMSGSIEKEAKRVGDKLNLKIKSIPAWGENKNILAVWQNYIEESLSGETANVLFVAHGIPLKDVQKGDKYPEHVFATAKSLGEKLPENVSWSLSYQSRVGPMKWTGPYLDNELGRLAKEGKTILIVPLSFVADCLETLYDLDIIAKQQIEESGNIIMKRVRVFNDDHNFAKALVKIATECNV
jgi:ferrochelatase